MATLCLDDVWKRYGEVEAVRALNLTCEDGQMLALLGPSGCGKSSTLKMIAGIESVSRGEIYFDDRPVSRLAPGERNIAMVFEDYALYPHLSVFDNIAFPLRVRNATRWDITIRVDQAIELLALDAIRDQNVKSLSGGAQQRVAIGRALVREPELLLFDEPLSHLDADQKVLLRTEIKRLQQTSGLTSILVTHDQTEAVAMADLVAVMDGGELQQLDSPEALYHRPANLFVAGFIGEPPMNLMPAAVVDEAGGLGLRGDGWNLALERADAARLRGRAGSHRVILGIRPEHVAVFPGDSAADDTSSLRTTVFFREPRGDVDVLLFSRNGRTGPHGDVIVAEVPGPAPLRAGEAATLRFAPDKVALFDADSGRNLVVS